MSKLSCGHDDTSWASICSKHMSRYYDKSCRLCVIGRCLECHPSSPAVGEEFEFFNRETGEGENPFPNLGPRTE